MRNFTTAILFSALTLPLFGARQETFAVNAFNSVVMTSGATNVVFSPVSFELDCAIIAETLETIPKAKVSETLGALFEFESVYTPVMSVCSGSSNGFHMAQARGFCLPDPALANPVMRMQLERIYRTSVCALNLPRGIDAWFQAEMDGEMEDFTSIRQRLSDPDYSFYDLVSVSLAWEEPFPTNNTKQMKFYAANGQVQETEFMTDVRKADTWEADVFTLLRLPLEGGTSFFAIIPKPDVDFSEVRATFTSVEIANLLAVTHSLTEKGVYHDSTVIAIPKVFMRTENDLLPAFATFHIPTSGPSKISGSLHPRFMKQIVKFAIAEQGRGVAPIAEKPAEKIVRITPDVRKFILNRPFLFFVHHPDTKTVPVVGIYTGECK